MSNTNVEYDEVGASQIKAWDTAVKTVAKHKERLMQLMKGVWVGEVQLVIDIKHNLMKARS